MKWDLTNYYKTYEDFRADLEKGREIIAKLASFKGKLKNENDFVEFYKEQIEMTKIEKVFLYAQCSMDLDRRNTKAVSDMQEVMFLFQSLSQALAWEDSEVLSLGKEYVIGVIDRHPEIEELRFGFENLFRKASHTPSSDAQSVIANYGALSEVGYDTYQSLTNGDIKEHIIKGEDGEKIDVNGSNWTRLVSEAKTPKGRQKVFEVEFERYAQNKNAYASIYNAVLQADIALAKSKNFDTALEMHLFQNNIPVSLYHNLIKVAHDAAPTIKKYLKIRKNVLGLSKYHTYDRFLSLVQEDEKKVYSYEEGKQLFYDSIEKFTPEFKEFAREATKDGYVDVYPQTGKRTGAYSNSVSDVHPCILLNYAENLDSVFTLAHEAGHSTHSLFSQKYQPTSTQGYTIFVAEIASTFNEHNLLDYLLTKGELSKNEKIKLIQNAIDDIMSTFIRQTLFGEYEYIAHTMAEKGEPITEESLSNIMIKLYKEYYGLDIEKEKVKKYVWAYIPHFFESPYYVYQYATSFSASLAIYQNVKEGKPGAFDKYLSLLKAGGSKYPIDIVKGAGVDFTSPEPLKAVEKRFKELVADLEKVLAE